jgi:hypothetical protein
MSPFRYACVVKAPLSITLKFQIYEVFLTRYYCMDN